MPRGTRKSNDEPTRGTRPPQPQTSHPPPASHPKPNSQRGKKRPSASHTEDYLSDDGFVADGSHDGGPKKKAKTATDKPRAPQAKDKSGEEESWEVGAPCVLLKRRGGGVEGMGMVLYSRAMVGMGLLEEGALTV